MEIVTKKKQQQNTADETTRDQRVPDLQVKWACFSTKSWTWITPIIMQLSSSTNLTTKMNS